MGFLIGLSLGILGVWVDHCNESASLGARQDRWSDWLVIPSMPGHYIAWRASGGYDWGVDEDWDYRRLIVIWNAVLWCAMFTGSATIALLVKRIWRRREA